MKVENITFNIEEVRERITQSKRVCILTHKNPDGDAIGSSIAVLHVVKEFADVVNIITPNQSPEFLKWMDGCESIVEHNINTQKSEELISKADLIFFTDFSAISRIEKLKPIIEQSNAYKIHIDHHPNPEQFADIVVSDTSVSSTAELVFWFFDTLGLSDRFNKAFADGIFVGIVTDTGKFSHNSSRKYTYTVVSELIDLGIDKDAILSSIYDNYSADRLRLLGYCLNEKLVHLPEYNTAFISITSDELKEFNFQVGDTEGFVNYPLSIKGVVFSALFIEKDGFVKVSLRSKGSFNVNEFSRKYFDGGGHMNAAGGESRMSIDKALKLFNDKVKQHANEII